MKTSKKKIFLSPKTLLILTTLSLLSSQAFCTDKSLTDKSLNVFVTVAPQAGILKDIAGELVETTVLVRGTCPDSFSPSAKQIKKLSQADAYFTLSLPLEELWLKKANLAKDKIKPMGKKIKLRELESFHNHHHEHAHGTKDPHIWLSPKNSLKMAENTYNVLVEMMPQHKERFKKGLEKYKEKMHSLDAKLKKYFKTKKDKNIFVFHPVFGYLADDYGLKQIPIQIEGKEPSAKQLTQIIDLIKNRKAKIIFTQPEFSDKTARAIAKQTNTKLVPFFIYNDDLTISIKDLLDKLDSE